MRTAMVRLLKSIHIGLVLLLMLYAGKKIVLYAMKLITPQAERVRFWDPGWEMLVIGFSFVFLLGILMCSTRMLRDCSWRLSGILHGGWLICFTLFGWFSVSAPFRLHELVGVDFEVISTVRRAETVFFFQALAVYFVVVFFISLPLVLRWADFRRKKAKR